MALNDSFQRPIIYLNNWHGVNALLDTGALFPVWTASEKVLESLDGKMIQKGVAFSGFGGRTSGNLYKLKNMCVGKLIFPEMAIVSCSDLKDVPYHIVLSATMFKNLIYEIDDKNHKFNVAIPDNESNVRNLRMEDSNGRLHILCHSV